MSELEKGGLFGAPVAGESKDVEEGAAAGGEEVVPEEECAVEFKPVVQLDEQEVVTGEESEEVLFKMRSKLFRFDADGQQWKERGTGDVRLLKHNETNKIRLLMRREKTLKICMNHYVNADVELQENVGSDRSWVWNAVDYAEGERDECVLAIRFANTENAQAFKKEYDAARAHMKELLSKPADSSTENKEEEAKTE
uniref:RanBD1 domain-containing protein n=1 Tax=Timspurckia oligopyrenoides TaxID=708627 RepID=A0A7S0ZC19_9RHOD|mmetsp:Transcript_11930/g.21610  ORF Transcript_11930/g.21610 Transcript_11930/m.21610 type:complete len:197 (+) Transcript_11930:99-689(+)